MTVVVSLSITYISSLMRTITKDIFIQYFTAQIWPRCSLEEGVFPSGRPQHHPTPPNKPSAPCPWFFFVNLDAITTFKKGGGGGAEGAKTHG